MYKTNWCPDCQSLCDSEETVKGYEVCQICSCKLGNANTDMIGEI